MEEKAQDPENNEGRFPYCIEKELEYQIKERKVSFMEKVARSNDLNTSFAGTLHMNFWDCAEPGTEEILDSMLEEDERAVYDLLDYIEEESPVPN